MNNAKLVLFLNTQRLFRDSVKADIKVFIKLVNIKDIKRIINPNL